MFVLSRMVDTVKTPPYRFGQDYQQCIIDTLNVKLANKIVYDLGLCICFFDFESIGDSFVLPGCEGCSFTKVHFRYVVFRPFLDEILRGKIKSCSSEGVTVSMTFFDDILVPSDKLPHPSKFRENEQVWVWDYQTEDGSAELFMEPGSQVRFKVVEEKFCETQPVDGTAPPEIAQPSLEDQSEKKIPYQIIGSMSESGLGCLQWWNS